MAASDGLFLYEIIRTLGSDGCPGSAVTVSLVETDTAAGAATDAARGNTRLPTAELASHRRT
jgi:hypothetical protein